MTAGALIQQRPVKTPVSMDDALAIVYLPSNAHARNRLLDIDAGYSAAVAAVKNITISTGPATADGLLSVTTLSRGSTDTAVAFTGFQYVASRVGLGKALDAVGVALAAGTIPTDKWGIYLYHIHKTTGVVSSTAGAANFSTGYDNEAAAITALPATPAGELSMGHVALKTKVATTFIGGTDGLQGGSSGNVSSDTNFYQTAVDITLTAVTTIPWDFAGGSYARHLAAQFHTTLNQAMAIQLEASGTGGVTGDITAWVSAP